MYQDDIRLDRNTVDVALLKRLLEEQFPEWADLPIRRAEPDGWDNRTFRIGDRLKARLPTGAWYALQVEKEHRWLPWLAPQLPLAVPAPLAKGRPGDSYPWPWSVYGWIEGEPATTAPIANRQALARSLAAFLRALRAVDATDGPAPGRHNFFRGAPVAVYHAETEAALAALEGRIDTDAAADVWRTAVASEPSGPRCWFHGDVASGNLLVRDGALAAVIDFGSSGVGDPACDLVIAWTMFSGDDRRAFRESIDADAGKWQRARGWALWKALITLAKDIDGSQEEAAAACGVIDAVIAEHATAVGRPSRGP